MPVGYLPYIDVGYVLVIGNDIFGDVLSKDEDNDVVNMEKAATQLHLAGSKVKLRLYLVKDLITTQGKRVKIGQKKVGGAYIPKNSCIKCTYKNNSGYVTTKFNMEFEYEY